MTTFKNEEKFSYKFGTKERFNEKTGIKCLIIENEMKAGTYISINKIRSRNGNRRNNND